MVDLASNEAAPNLVTAEQVHTEFEKLLRDRNQIGVRNFLGDAVLESRNPFQRTRRSVNKAVVAVSIMLLLGLLILYWFHLR
ncbi:MAG TPA: hypothetical protein VIY49_11740 [Bryobacteraceae bacterium]